MMAHFCSIGNQPRMRAETPAGEIRNLKFTFVDATNLAKPSDGHMQSLAFTFQDKDQNNLSNAYLALTIGDRSKHYDHSWDDDSDDDEDFGENEEDNDTIDGYAKAFHMGEAVYQDAAEAGDAVKKQARAMAKKSWADEWPPWP